MKFTKLTSSNNSELVLNVGFYYNTNYASTKTTQTNASAQLYFSLEVQDSLVGVHVGLLRIRKAKHPTHNSAAIQTPAFITHLSPSPSMLYFHHTLRDKSASLCNHQDWLETDFLNPHPTGRLEED